RLVVITLTRNVFARFLIEGRASPDFSVPLAICCLICSVICLNNGALLSLAIKIFKPTNISPQFYLTVYTQYIQYIHFKSFCQKCQSFACYNEEKEARVMDLFLKDKTVIITGASQGLGRASALAFALEGAHVWIASRSEEKLKHAVEDIQKQSGNK